MLWILDRFKTLLILSAKIIIHSICQYILVTGEIVQPDDLDVVQPGNAERPEIKDLSIRPLYNDKAGDDVERYTWFQESVGYYQVSIRLSFLT